MSEESCILILVHALHTLLSGDLEMPIICFSVAVRGPWRPFDCHQRSLEYAKGDGQVTEPRPLAVYRFRNILFLG